LQEEEQKKMQERLLKLIDGVNPKHFWKAVKKDSEVYNFVNTFYGNTFSEKIFNFLTPNQNVCQYGNSKVFNSFDKGYRFCGKASVCQCAKESVSKKSKESHALRTPEQKAASVQKTIETNLTRYGVANAGQTPVAKQKHAELYAKNNEEGNMYSFEMKYGICFEITGKNDKKLRERMAIHYSQPRGFVGRSICLAIYHGGVYYGHIVFGSATLHLPGRNEFLEVTTKEDIQRIANNIFYNISSKDGYPIRNFTTRVLVEAEKLVVKLWKEKYNTSLIGFETLVECSERRNGELYLKGGYEIVGKTKGYTCKRVSGIGSDGWGSKRVWNKDKNYFRPKIVLCKKINF